MRKYVRVTTTLLAAAITAGWLVERRQAGPDAASESRRAPQLISLSQLTNRGQGGVAFCYAPDTPEDVINYYESLQNLTLGPLQPQYYVTSRWSGSLGTPRSLTWSFIPDGVTVDGKPNQLFSRMDSLFASAGGRATWIAQFEAAFARWAALTGTSYTRIRYNNNDWDDGAAFGSSGNANRGDIRIAMIEQDGPGNVLAYNYYPPYGDMVLDRDESWNQAANNYRYLRNVVLHEHGHGIGLRHVCPRDRTKLMEPNLSTTFDGPQHDDIRAAHALYGDISGNNNTLAQAVNLGVLDVGPGIQVGPVPNPAVSFGSVLSLDQNGEQDYFSFTIPEARGVTVTVTPVGRSYDSSAQNNNGSCGSGNMINSLTAADLAVQVLGAGGVVLATAASQPAGVAETVSGLALLTPGTYYVRVYETGAQTMSQLYTLSLTATIIDCNANGVLDTLDLANGTSQDCNANGVPDECDSNPVTDRDGDLIPDECEFRYGDFDLDGDTDMSDFALLQACLKGPDVAQNDPACLDVRVTPDAVVDQTDVLIFLNCLSGPNKPYDPDCNPGGG